MVVARRRQHLLEIADLHIRSEFVRGNDQANGAGGEFPLQLLDAGDGWIIGIADAEDDFKLGIVLQAVAAEARVDVGVRALQWLQNRNWWQSLRGAVALGRLRSTQKRSGAPQTQQIV